MNDTTPTSTALPAGLPRRQVLKAGALALGVTMAGRFAFAADNGSALTASEYDALDAWAMAEAVRAGELSGAQLLGAALARYRAVNPLVNAVNMLHEDYARALLAERTAAGEAGSWRYPFYVQIMHPALGAEMIRQLGSSSSLVKLVADHHTPVAETARQGLDRVRLAELQRADGFS